MEIVKADYSVGEAAGRLHISRQRVYQMIEEGRLIPTVEGGKRFTASELARVKTLRAEPKRKIRSPAELLLQASALFETGCDLLTCVRKLGVGPTKVRSLFDEWRTPLGGTKKKTVQELVEEGATTREAFNREFDEELKAQRKRFQDRHERTLKLVLGSNGRTPLHVPRIPPIKKD